jgi:5-methylcytosine-specific restriction endonuclease McrA
MPILKRRNSDRVRNDPYRWLYQSAQWHRFSKEYLKVNRLCKMCLDKGITEIALVVDHIIPLVQWIPQGGNPYDLNNLQPLSKRCHSIKTKKENK